MQMKNRIVRKLKEQKRFATVWKNSENSDIKYSKLKRAKFCLGFIAA